MARRDRGDLGLGLAVLAAAAIAIGATIWLSAPLRHDSGQGPLYADFAQLDGLGVQAPVIIQGFRIGSVDAISPHDAGRRGGQLRFRVRMTVQWQLADSTRLPLKEGTRAIIQSALVGSPSIVLVSPPGRAGRLGPGAVIEGVVETSPVTRVLALADSISAELSTTLVKTRAAFDSLGVVAGVAARGVRTTDAAIPGLVSGVARDVASLDSAISGLRGLMSSTQSTTDSAQAVLGETRRAVAGLSQSVNRHDAEIAHIIANLDTTSALLQDFVRQVEAKPTRLLTGVKPAPQYQRPLH